MLAGNIVATVGGGLLGFAYALASEQGLLATLAFYQLGGLISMLSFLLFAVTQEDRLR